MPASTPNRNARHVLPIRLSLDEQAEIRRAAERRGLPVSVYIREQAVKSARRDLKKAA